MHTEAPRGVECCRGLISIVLSLQNILCPPMSAALAGGDSGTHCGISVYISLEESDTVVPFMQLENIL